MEDFGADGRKEMLSEPLDYGGKARNEENRSAIELGPSNSTNGLLNDALHDEGGDGRVVSSLSDEKFEPEATGSGPGFVLDTRVDDLKSDKVQTCYDEMGHHESIRYSIDELLGLWEVSVNCETAWNHVLTALGPLMEEMYEMHAMPDTKYQRRRSKNSERRQRFKARLEAMLAVSQNNQDAGNTLGESKNEDCNDTTDSNPQVVDEYHVHQIQKDPLKAPFKARKYRYESDEYVESFQPQAFAVDGEPDFESGDPQDGWEYLRRVIWEAARCPKVVVANIDPEKLVSEQTPYIPKIPAIPSCPQELLPSTEWESTYLADFKQLRKELLKLRAPAESCVERLPSVRDKAAWEILCFGAVTSTQAEDLEEQESVTIEANCGTSPGYEEIDGATDDDSTEFHPPLTRTNNNAVSRGRAGIEKVSDSPSLDELELHSARDDIVNDDSIQLGTQEERAADCLHPTDPPEDDVISASGGTEAPETRTSRLEDPTEDDYVSNEHEGSSEMTAADLLMSRTAQGSGLSDPNGFHEEDHVDNVTLRHGNLASSDFQGTVAPLLVTTGMQLKLEEVSAEYGEEISTATVLTNSYVRPLDVAELSDHHAAEFADTFDQWPESSGLVVDIPGDTSESRDRLYDPVDPSGEDMTYEYPAESYDFAAHSHGSPEFEDDDLQTADLMEKFNFKVFKSLKSGFEVFNSQNVLEESEDEGRESISDIDKSVQELFARVFRVDKAWELPLIHILLRLDVVSRGTLFRYHVSWLDSVGDLPQERALWLLGLAAVVDIPLNGDTTAAFRAMLRYCAGVRSSKEALGHEELHMLNALVTVAGLCFGQAEADLT